MQTETVMKVNIFLGFNYFAILELNSMLILDGYYLYANSYHIKHANETSLLVSPLITIYEQSVFCLKFFYHMYADSTASNTI